MMNLHDIVRRAITAVFNDEPCLLIQSTGATFSKGRSTAAYADALEMLAQVQTLGGDDLQVIGETERTERDRKFYLYAASSNADVPAGIIRAAGRTGDYIYRLNYDTYWKIYNVAEDFSGAGWVQVLASEQAAGGVPSGVIDSVNAYLHPEPEPEPGANTDPEGSP